MKTRIALIANIMLVALASFMVGTNSILWHRPETPQELLKK